MAISPPKPWERPTQSSSMTTNDSASASASTSSLRQPLTNGHHHPTINQSQANNTTSPLLATTTPSPSSSSSSSLAPPLPPKSDPLYPTGSLSSINNGLNGFTSNYGSSLSANSPFNSRYNSYGLNSAYGGFGGTSAYGGYSRLGGLGSYGGYGSPAGLGYGGMGGYGGLGGYGSLNNPYGVNPHGDPTMGQPSFGQTIANSTQSTFQLLESLVMAFSGFSQLLESTFMMTHSSLFTFIQLIEQFNLFKYSIGKILSLFDLIKWAKGVITGQEPIDRTGAFGAWVESFKQFDPRNNNSTDPQGKKNPTSPKPSRKPIIIFFLTVFGIPYLMNKLIKSIAAKQQQQQEQQPPNTLDDPNQLRNFQQQQATLAIDPSKLTFVKAIHPFQSTKDNNLNEEPELSFEANDIIAVLLPTTVEEKDRLGWWKGRLRDGRIGWFPKNYVEEIPLRNPTRSTTSTVSSVRIEPRTDGKSSIRSSVKEPEKEDEDQLEPNKKSKYKIAPMMH